MCRMINQTSFNLSDRCVLIVDFKSNTEPRSCKLLFIRSERHRSWVDCIFPSKFFPTHLEPRSLPLFPFLHQMAFRRSSRPLAMRLSFLEELASFVDSIRIQSSSAFQDPRHPHPSKFRRIAITVSQIPIRALPSKSSPGSFVVV